MMTSSADKILGKNNMANIHVLLQPLKPNKQILYLKIIEKYTC
jgi:hypothetical protein